ncbi:hypothetical protein MRS44_005430 [Fusarium solani]|uniref:uncharacterized protein n=1 Tax=Fusarium solani TaxID=169388 RepID=UPI0032C455A0|nr:hypothetical protein MRS44_005430 [Fusarium solani]
MQKRELELGLIRWQESRLQVFMARSWSRASESASCPTPFSVVHVTRRAVGPYKSAQFYVVFQEKRSGNHQVRLDTWDCVGHLDGLALAPPKDVTPNFVHPPNNSPLALGVFITRCVISTVCVILRGYGRVFLLRKLQIEEFLAFLAYPWILLGQNKNEERVLVGCTIVTFVQITANIAIIVALNLQCTPDEAMWDFRVEAKCFNLFHPQVSSATIHLMLLPQRVIWKLNMGWKKRLGVSVIFSLGLLACISAAFRLASTVAYGDSEDDVFNPGPLIFRTTAEMTCGFFIIYAPCGPMILRESGVLAKIKKVIGMATRSKSTNQRGGQYELDREGLWRRGSHR